MGDAVHSSEPIPGNPWPHNMMISVDVPHHLSLLLFVRQAWSLNDNDVPAVSPAPEPGTSTRPAEPGSVELNEQWRQDWAQAWTEFAPRQTRITTPAAEIQHLLDTLTDEELWDAVSPAPSPIWFDGLDHGAFNHWLSSLRGELPVSLHDNPEHQSLPALITAWKTGLVSIIELPYAGYYADRITRTHLVVSNETRHCPELYSRALATPDVSGTLDA